MADFTGTISKVGILIAAITIITGYLGMNVIPPKDDIELISSFLIWAIVVGLTLLTSIKFWPYVKRIKYNKNKAINQGKNTGCEVVNTSKKALLSQR